MSSYARQTVVLTDGFEDCHGYEDFNMSTALPPLLARFASGSKLIFSPFSGLFRSSTRSVEESARRHVCGLYQATRRNLERMADVVVGSDYQRMHHMLSVSDWDHTGVVRQVAAEAQGPFAVLLSSYLRNARMTRAIRRNGARTAKRAASAASIPTMWSVEFRYVRCASMTRYRPLDSLPMIERKTSSNG